MHAVDEDDAKSAGDASEAAKEKDATNAPFLMAIEIHAPD